jgi:UDP-glucose 4-epimerase
LISANMTLSPTPKLDGLKNILRHLPPIRNPELYENNPFAPLFDREHTQKWLVFEPKYDAGSIVNL